MYTQDVNQAMRGDVCGNIVLRLTWKNFSTSPCYHVVIKYVCLGVCTYCLAPIFCSVEFFIQEQAAFSFTQIIRWTFFDDDSSYFWNKIVPFNFLVFLRQFNVICAIFMVKGFGVAVESVIVVGLGWSYFFLVNYIWRQNFPT